MPDQPRQSQLQQLTSWSFFLILLDQLSKTIAGYFGWVSVNQGIAWGWLVRLPRLWLLVAIGGWWLALVLAAWHYWRRQPMIAALFMAGSFSNWFDRAVYQGVRDWLWLPGFNWRNNLADWYLFLAVLLIVYDWIYVHRTTTTD